VQISRHCAMVTVANAFDWFMQRRERHFQHHRIHKQNLRLGAGSWDKLFGSYAEPGSHRKGERLRAK
jgi:sterol desaturase/sphingolipid hydroxylase (fatty acid hydroxylase superfamily)